MYINEVIEQARAYNPNEYSRREMLAWCDEVSAMLSVEDRIIYRERTLPVAKDRSVLLPEGVRFENIVKVYMGAAEVPKAAYKTHGRHIMLPHWLNFHYKDSCYTDMVKVVYEEPYVPIRMPKYIGEIKVDRQAGTIVLNDCEFIPGDSLIIKTGDKVYENIHLMKTEYDPDNERAWVLDVSDIPEALDGKAEAVVTRAITDKTVCGSPYDTMYIDYILAKIALFQKDMQTYSLYINRFDTKLSQYKQWLTSRMPHESTEMRNWW